ncbi:HlyD family efflux transporter periplasmic adaptor subunit [Caballeronia sp. LZ008]|uniref:HlyD family efflux transporter periplasmic adaptor subunit n=1 Tax=unclassified Caballeronia TaxID=2646786 RepID=UPI002028ED68|nr:MULTISPECIES: HlyD family efflux transporter periplasmic adaptor subunit [unclassified Caballeronia]MDR5796376.1 HlyD family efflux transporter periplasmic adaptor subunit [Caballeronia sp. LZ008]
MQPTPLPHFRDVPWRWIAYAASIFVTIAIVFGFIREIELKQDVPCEIVSPSEVKIRGVSGLIASIYVQPGQRVAAGTPLFKLQRDLSLTTDGNRRQSFDMKLRDDQIRAIDDQYAAQRNQLSAQREASRLTESSRRAELAALDGQLAQNGQLVSEYVKRLARLNTVSDYVTADKLEQASADVHQGKASVAQGMARRGELVGAISVAKNEQTRLDAQLQEMDARHKRDIQDVKARFEQGLLDSTVSAPKSGVVTFSNLVEGRMLAPENVALVIATEDTGPLRAALSIPSRRRGFVREGQIVRLKLDAFPYVKFGTYEARIDSISRTAVLPASPPTSPASSSSQSGSNSSDTTEGQKSTDGDYLAWATLSGETFDFDGQHLAILPGMRATASIVVERRTIAEWVLAPLFRIMRG